MSTPLMSTPTVAFSELSKNSKRVADTLDRTQRVHITRRDGEDLYLTTARHDQQREETADITARLLAALVRSDAGERAIVRALPSVFPWIRHLSSDELKEFVAELIDATYDAAQLDVHGSLHRVVVEWRATARILADPELTAQLTRRLPDEDHGEVTAP
ncbi:prevent-host-death family protein [Streptomyces sp. NBC_01236]|uniref:prevent-host-death family protein n=1 Tax=Streptomyces sp. NBC_01236 TaxID=2903789 RepID=UPI002E139164|nr:prevent-host-death family protein [Streptomyces sp. NBC_01236]